MDQPFRKHFVILVLLGIFCCCYANDQELFLRGNKLYHEGKYQLALQEYKDMKRKGSAAWYNMGNCYYHMEKYPKSVVCWKRAESGARYTDVIDIDSNLNQLEKKLGRSVFASYDTFFHDIVRHLSSTSLLFLQFLFLLCWYLFILFFFMRKRNKLFFSLAVIMGCMSILTGPLVYVKKTSNKEIGVVMSQSEQMFAGPDTRYHTLAKLYGADQVQLLEEHEQWYKIKHHNTVGWVVADAIKRV